MLEKLLTHASLYLRVLFLASVIITNQVRPFSQALNNKLMALCPTVDILDIVRCRLKVAGCIVTLGDEDVIVHSALKWLVQWNRGPLRMSADLKGRQG